MPTKGYVKRADNMIVFNQLRENHVFYAVLSSKTCKFFKRGSSGLHIPEKDSEAKGLVPFSATEYVGLTVDSVRST